MNRLRQWLSDILAAPGLLRDIDRKLDRLLKQQVIYMATVNEALQEMQDAVRENTDAEESMEIAFGKIADMVQALRDNQTDPATAQRIGEAAAAIRSNSARTATAVLANTPAAP